MLVTSLTKMEQIVAGHPNLHWFGWDVVLLKKNKSAQFEKNGVYYKGEWHKQFIYPITENGWSIPNYLGNEDV